MKCKQTAFIVQKCKQTVEIHTSKCKQIPFIDEKSKQKAEIMNYEDKNWTLPIDCDVKDSVIIVSGQQVGNIQADPNVIFAIIEAIFVLIPGFFKVSAVTCCARTSSSLNQCLVIFAP